MNKVDQAQKMLGFERLRILAAILDIKLGVKVRKDVMAGSELLTLCTDAKEWSQYLISVVNRLDLTAGSTVKETVLHQAGLLNLSLSFGIDDRTIS